MVQNPTPEQQAEIEKQLQISANLPYPYDYLKSTLNAIEEEAKEARLVKTLYAKDLVVGEKEKSGLQEAGESKGLEVSKDGNHGVTTVAISLENLRRAILKCDHFMVIYQFECLSEEERRKLTVEELLEILPSYNPVFYLRHSAIASGQELGGMFPTQIHSRSFARRTFLTRFQTFLKHFGTRKASFPPRTLRYLFHLAHQLENRSYADKLWQTHKQDETLDMPAIRNYLNLLVRTRASNDLRTWKSRLRDPESAEVVKAKIEDVLEYCTSRNVPWDSRIVGPLLLAYARLGRMRDVEDLLEKVWQINISKIQDGNQLIPASILDKENALHPVSDFFGCLINAYGMNYSIPRLLPILDFFLKEFRGTLSDPNAELLVEYAYKARWNKVRAKLETPDDLVEDVTAFLSQHNVKPTLTIYDLRFRELMHRQRIGQGMPMLQEYLKDFGVFIRSPVDEICKMKAGGNEVFSFKVMRQTDIEYQKKRHMGIFRRWLELYCTRGAKSLSKSNPYFAWKTVPDIIREWGGYLGNNVAYEVATGFCVLQLKEEEESPSYSVTRSNHVGPSKLLDTFPEYAYGADKDWYDE